MKTTIIYCHPNDPNKENSMLKVVCSELAEINMEYSVFNLYGDVFPQALMSSDDTELPESEEIEKRILALRKNIEESAVLLFVFPHWWVEIKTYIRRFMDRVFMDEWIGGSNLLSLRKHLNTTKAAFITSMQIPHVIFNTKVNNQHSDSLVLSMLKLCGIRNIKWINIGPIAQRSERYHSHKIDKIRDYIRSL